MYYITLLEIRKSLFWEKAERTGLGPSYPYSRLATSSSAYTHSLKTSF